MISLRASARPPLSLSLTLSAHSSSLWVVISARRSQFTWNPFWDYPLTVLPFSVILYAYRHWDFRVIFALLVIVSPLWTPFFNICIYVSVAGVCVCIRCNRFQLPECQRMKIKWAMATWKNHKIHWFKWGIVYSAESTHRAQWKKTFQANIGAIKAKENNAIATRHTANWNKLIVWPRVYHFSAQNQWPLNCSRYSLGRFTFRTLFQLHWWMEHETNEREKKERAENIVNKN